MEGITLLSILDSAIKIGLGGLISGLTTYYVMRRQQSMAFEKNTTSERRSIIRQVILDTSRMEEVSHQYAFCIVQIVNRHLDGTVDKELLESHRETLQAVWSLKGAITKTSAHVRLLGDDEVIRLFESYRKHRAHLHDLCIQAEGTKDLSLFESEEWCRVTNAGDEAYKDLCQRLSVLHFD